MTPTLAEIVAALVGHVPVDDPEGMWCDQCGRDWPCPEGNILDRLQNVDAELFDVERLARVLRTIHPGPAPWPGPMTSDEMAVAILVAAKDSCVLNHGAGVISEDTLT